MAKMTKKKWQEFWSAILIFLMMATYFLYSKGVFEDADLVILGIVGVVFCAVGLAVYFYVKNRTEEDRNNER